MAISDLLNRRMRALPDSDEEVYSDVSASDDRSDDEERSDETGSIDGSEDSLDESNASSQSDNDSDSEDQDEDDDEGSEDDVQASLNNISFGALAKAQASLGPNRKRKGKSGKQGEEENEKPSPLDDIRARIQEAREQKRKASLKSKDGKAAERLTRSSKHAPTVQSSKIAVSRKRTVVEPPSVPKSRDPRFDPTVVGRGGHSSAAPSKAYAFLDEYRAQELKELKERLAKTKDPRQKEALQKEIRSATDRLRTIENNKRQNEILAEHKKREKQLIREGKKSTPYYLKKSELKKQALLKKYEGMNSRDRVKALERRRKKAASKERKEMPMERRGLEGGGDDGGRKRRRVA